MHLKLAVILAVLAAIVVCTLSWHAYDPYGSLIIKALVDSTTCLPFHRYVCQSF